MVTDRVLTDRRRADELPNPLRENKRTKEPEDLGIARFILLGTKQVEMG